MATFGERLKHLREKLGISQNELATRLNLSQSTIAYYEKDKKEPNQSTLNKLADLFDTNTDYILGRTKNSKPINEIDKSTVREEHEEYYVDMLSQIPLEVGREFSELPAEKREEIVEHLIFNIKNSFKKIEKERNK